MHHGHVFGVAAVEGERLLAVDDGSGPVVALFNGAKRDISPRWHRKDRVAALARWWPGS